MSWFTNDHNAFFSDLAKNNNKEWFDANRKRYEQSVKRPFETFVAEAISRVSKVDKNVRITPKEAIFRINKDVRFSKDKAPYKLSSSANISPGGRKDHATPGIYCELGPAGVKFIAGAYQPDKDQLQRIRTAISRDPAGFKKTTSSKPFKQLFGEILGEKNKVLPPEFKASTAKEPLIANKQFYVAAEQPAKLVSNARLLEVFLEHYEAIRPFNDWLANAMRK